MTAIELFACSGGLAEGFRRAGLRFDLTLDYSADACASYEANLGDRPVQIDVRDLLRMARAGWSPGRLDLLVADPPCAPWSRAGKRQGLDDERDLLRETVELIAILRPRAYLIGNIPGLDDVTNLGVVRATIGALARSGYCARDFASLDAADYGVPQRRVRPFWFGHREGPCLVWPARTHCDPAELGHQSLPGHVALLPWVTCRDALGHLSTEEIGRPVRLKHEGKRAAPRHPPSEIDEPARCITAGDGQGSKRSLRLEPTGDTRAKRDPSTRGPQSARVGNPDAPAMTLDARVARVGSGEAQVLAWPWDRPATTVLSEDRIPGPGHGPIHSRPGAIVISEKAAAILQGFPEGWRFVGETQGARWAQIGMAVPPPVAEAIGRSVAAWLCTSARAGS